MKKYLFIAILFNLLVFTSCKNYLDVKPYGKVVPKTTDEYSALLHTILNKVDYGNDNVLFGNFSTVLEKDAITDNLDASIWGMESRLPNYIGDRLNSVMRTYPNLYAIIRDANIVIGNLKAEGSEEKEVLAVAYALRGVCYYNLIRNFSPAYDKSNSENQLGVPIVTSFDIEERPLRNSIAEVAELIEGDFKKSIEMNLTKEEFRFTSDVVKFFLARLYFWTEDWDKLVPLGEEMTSKYNLLAGKQYLDMMNSINEKQGNVLMKSYLFYDQGSFASYISGLTNKASRPVSADFTKLFQEGNRDIRFSMSFNNQRKVTKILNARLRAAELYFMLAEAYVHKNKDLKALAILNEIRNKRIEGNIEYKLETLPPVDVNYLIKVDCEGKSLTPLMYALFTERQKEFFVEGDRWWELKRNGCPEFWVALYTGIKFTTKEYMYTAPIYKRDVELIKGLKQNDGYEN